MFPYGYTPTPADDNDELMEAARQSVKAIKAVHSFSQITYCLLKNTNEYF
jgi:hypothetical protein